MYFTLCYTGTVLYTLVVGDGTFSHKIDCFRKIKEILNLRGHQNCITGSRVTAILLNGWTLPIGEAASGRVCACSLRSRLVSVSKLSQGIPMSCHHT